MNSSLSFHVICLLKISSSISQFYRVVSFFNIIKNIYLFQRSREPELNFCLILLFGLDPTVRLALFKSNENKVSVTKLPKKTKPRRNSYFEGMVKKIGKKGKVGR